jgi:hypothetical protein
MSIVSVKTICCVDKMRMKKLCTGGKQAVCDGGKQKPKIRVAFRQDDFIFYFYHIYLHALSQRPGTWRKVLRLDLRLSGDDCNLTPTFHRLGLDSYHITSMWKPYFRLVLFVLENKFSDSHKHTHTGECT